MEAEMATSVMVILRVKYDKYDFTLGALGDFPLILQHRFSCSVANLVIFLRRGDGNPASAKELGLPWGLLKLWNISRSARDS